MDSENILYDVCVNLIVTIIAFLFGIIFAKFWHLVKIRHARKVLGPFLKGNLQIVVGRFLGNFAPFEPTGLFGVGDAMGLAEFKPT